MFDAETLFGCTAQQLHELREASEEEFQKKLQALLFVQQLWTVGGKMEAYQGESRVKLTLLEARRVGWEERGEESLLLAVRPVLCSCDVATTELETVAGVNDPEHGEIK